MNKIIKQKEGFTLLITIIGLALMTTLGFAILTSTTNNFKATDLDSKNQSAYYIAEAGINHTIDLIGTEINKNSNNFLTSAEFFNNIEKKFIIKEIPLIQIFENNFGSKPSVKIKVNLSPEQNVEGVKDYVIESTGIIGKSSRSVVSTISVKWEKQKEEVETNNKKTAINTNQFELAGKKLNAPGQIIVVPGKTNTNWSSEIHAKTIYFKAENEEVMEITGTRFGDEQSNLDKVGDIYFDGDANISQQKTKIYGNIHASGDLKFKGGAEIWGDLFVNGNLNIGGNTKIFGDVYVKKEFEGSFDSEIKGSLFVGGNAFLESVEIEGNSEFHGNLKVHNNTKFHKEVKYIGFFTKGDYNFPSENKLKKVNTLPLIDSEKFYFITPGKCNITMKSKDWYHSKNYSFPIKNMVGENISGKNIFYENSQNNSLLSDTKNTILIVKGNVDLTSWKSLEDVVIISEGDINFRTESNFTGVLVSLNGKINFNSNKNFKGAVISNEGIILPGGSFKIDLEDIEEYFNRRGISVPVDIDCSSNLGSSDENSPSTGVVVGSKISIKIKRSIKEQ